MDLLIWRLRNVWKSKYIRTSVDIICMCCVLARPFLMVWAMWMMWEININLDFFKAHFRNGRDGEATLNQTGQMGNRQHMADWAGGVGRLFSVLDGRNVCLEIFGLNWLQICINWDYVIKSIRQSLFPLIDKNGVSAFIPPFWIWLDVVVIRGAYAWELCLCIGRCLNSMLIFM